MTLNEYLLTNFRLFSSASKFFIFQEEWRTDLCLNLNFPDWRETAFGREILSVIKKIAIVLSLSTLGEKNWEMNDALGAFIQTDYKKEIFLHRISENQS